MKHNWQMIVGLTLLGSLAAVGAESAGGPPLPSVDSVLERLAEHSQTEAANDLAFKQRYHFTRTKAFEVRDSKGELNKRELKTQANKPVRNPEKLDAATKTRDGVPGKSGRKSDFAVDRNFLQRFEFTLVGREIINDRPTLILDLVPAAKKPPEPELKDRIINKMAGRVWVDEAESVLVQADFHLTEKVNVVGGIVGAIMSFSLSFNRARTAEGLWFTPRLDWQLDAREVFVRRTMAVHEEITEVQLAR